MILRSFTGAFARVLPQDDSDPVSVTFTISNKPPPPVVVSFIVKVPLGVIQNEAPIELAHRDDFGPLIFTLVEGRGTFPGSNRRAFEPGEIIDFADDAPTAESSLPPSPVVIQHNNNTLDLDDLGLDSAEIDELTTQSASRIVDIRNTIAALQSSITDVRVQIRENQKAINEVRKAIRAVVVVYSILPDGTNSNEIYDKLVAKLDSLEIERDAMVVLLNERSTDLQIAQDDLVKISQLVK